jgi:hypothetical protein
VLAVIQIAAADHRQIDVKLLDASSSHLRPCPAGAPSIDLCHGRISLSIPNCAHPGRDPHAASSDTVSSNFIRCYLACPSALPFPDPRAADPPPAAAAPPAVTTPWPRACPCKGGPPAWPDAETMPRPGADAPPPAVHTLPESLPFPSPGTEPPVALVIPLPLLGEPRKCPLDGVALAALVADVDPLLVVVFRSAGRVAIRAFCDLIPLTTGPSFVPSC